jgi:hypothetical protein
MVDTARARARTRKRKREETMSSHAGADFSHAKRVSLGILALAAALGCGEDTPAPEAGGPGGPAAGGAPPLYAVMYEVFSDTGSDSYLSLLDSLDIAEVEVAKAREYPGGRAFLATYDGWVFVGDPTSPIVTRYSVGRDNVLQDERKLSLANYGLMAGNLDPWNVTFISPTKAYLFDLKEATHIIWNPSTMEILGEIKPPPELVREGLDLDGSPAVIRGNRLFRSLFWVDFDTAVYEPDHLLGIYDIENDRLVELVKETRCPAPGGLVHQDEQGNFYFGNWIWPVAGTLMRGAPRSCVLRLPAGSDRYDPAWSLHYADLAGGREGAMFTYLAGGKGLISVFNHEMTMFDASTDPWEYAGTPIWQIWNVDLATRAAAPLEGIPLNAGAYTPVHLDGRTFALVPGADWKETQAYEIKDGKGSPAFKIRGWTYQLMKVR